MNTIVIPPFVFKLRLEWYNVADDFHCSAL